jgi:hypothetical protein
MRIAIPAFLIGVLFGVAFLCFAVTLSGQRMYVGYGCDTPSSTAVALEKRGLPRCAESEVHILR